MSKPAIVARNLSKCYRVFGNQRSRLAHALWPRFTKGMQEVWALNNVSFQVDQGEAVAIIGRNGGGKSTLLEILSGTLTPTAGEVTLHGRISALLELGSGFNPEYTGRENVILSGLLLDLSRAEILARFEEIEAFAEIGEAINRPVKTYSSGMTMRLAFSVQVLLQPEILIVDEALGVGDFFFQQKCFARLRRLRDDGLTLLFVSHDMRTVRDICQRALYLREGTPVFFGDASTAIRMYMNDMRPQSSVLPLAQPAALPELYRKLAIDAAWSRQPEGAERLIAVHILDGNDHDVSQARLGDTIRVQVCYRTTTDDAGMTVSLAIKNRYDQVVCSTNSARLGVECIMQPDAPCAVFEFEMDLMLEAGPYSLRINLGHPTQPNRGEPIDTTDWFGPLFVHWDYETEFAPFLGMFGLPIRGRMK